MLFSLELTNCHGFLLPKTEIDKILLSIFTFFFILVRSQEYGNINTPPTLVIPDRNWRIYETETVGQIIARVHVEGSKKIHNWKFGIESHATGDHIPFHIDEFSGDVYLNESLIGRGGDNFFLYVTFTDGKSPVKNEVYVNILPVDSTTSHKFKNALYSQKKGNLSQYFPSFDQLPGVLSIRNLSPNNAHKSELDHISKDIVHIPDGSIFKNSGLNPDEENRKIIHGVGESGLRKTQLKTTSIMLPPKESTRLLPMDNSLHNTSKIFENSKKLKPNKEFPSYENEILYKVQTHIVVIMTLIIGLVICSIVAFCLWKNRLRIFGKNIKKSTKFDKQQPVSTICNNFGDENRNNMAMHMWNGPVAYGNRYVPWEGEQHEAQCLNGSFQITPIVTNSDNQQLASNHSINSTNIEANSDKWEYPRHRLKFFNILGEGAFGQVWRCEATNINGSDSTFTVAVKTLKENASEVEKKDLLSELEVLKSLDPHINIVRFIGCCTDKDPILIILEYINQGKLQTFLRSSRTERCYGNTHGKSNTLTSSDLTLFMHQIAKGMDYLASRGIIHRDLAARNILITDDFVCKVADFGFARDIIYSKIYERKSEGKLPIRWMAVESLYDNIFSVKSDVWSFGILMWEIVTLGSTPYPGISASEVMRKVRDGYRLEKPEHCRRELYNIMYYCWSQEPKQRPTFGELENMLDKLLQTEKEYIELERFPDHNYYNIMNLSGEKV